MFSSVHFHKPVQRPMCEIPNEREVLSDDNRIFRIFPATSERPLFYYFTLLCILH